MNEIEYRPGQCALCEATEPKGGLMRRQLPVGIYLLDMEDRIYRTGEGEYAFYCRLDGDCRRRKREIDRKAEEESARYLADPVNREKLLRHDPRLLIEWRYYPQAYILHNYDDGTSERIQTDVTMVSWGNEDAEVAQDSVPVWSRVSVDLNAAGQVLKVTLQGGDPDFWRSAGSDELLEPLFRAYPDTRGAFRP
jgi:hypothetical protein